MQIANVVRAAFMAAAAIWLAGCASQKETTAETPPPVIEEDVLVLVEVQPVVDPAVQAVIDSGKIDESQKRFGHSWRRIPTFSHLIAQSLMMKPISLWMCMLRT